MKSTPQVNLHSPKNRHEKLLWYWDIETFYYTLWDVFVLTVIIMSISFQLSSLFVFVKTLLILEYLWCLAWFMVRAVIFFSILLILRLSYFTWYSTSSMHQEPILTMSCLKLKCSFDRALCLFIVYTGNFVSLKQKHKIGLTSRGRFYYSCKNIL